LLIVASFCKAIYFSRYKKEKYLVTTPSIALQLSVVHLIKTFPEAVSTTLRLPTLPNSLYNLTKKL